MSKYDFSQIIDCQNAREYLEKLIKKEAFAEVRNIGKPISERQRGYEHLLFAWFAIEYGETLQYVKQVIFKQWVNPEIFKYERVNRKSGEIRIAFKSTEDIGSYWMTIAINRFKNWSAMEAGILLPEAENKKLLRQIEIEIEKNKEFI